MIEARELIELIDKAIRLGIKRGLLPENPTQEEIKNYLDYISSKEESKS